MPGACRVPCAPVPPQAPSPGPESTQMGAMAVAAHLPAEPLDDSVFTDAFIRCFLLGVGSGVLCEGGHLAWQFLGLHLDDLHAGLLATVGGWAQALAGQAPVIVWDHVAAL